MEYYTVSESMIVAHAVVLEREMDARVPLEPRHEDCEAADMVHERVRRQPR